jgi:hypothetical protein
LVYTMQHPANIVHQMHWYNQIFHRT